jgi:GDP/UDP-N,N'-diacetylbacillosamine 2-epimerase (hydrolysing)
MHLSEKFGLTYKEIESDGFLIDKKIEILDDQDSTHSISRAVGTGIIDFTKAFKELEPDVVVILGDRFEAFAAATACLLLRTPVAHIHGGEATEGLMDEAFRHAITKMSHLHFVSTKEYKKRVIQLGENPERVFLVGSLGVENIKNTKLLSREHLERELKVRFSRTNILITFHPVTLEPDTARSQIEQLLSVLEDLQDTTCIFTYPNSDLGGLQVIEAIDKFVSEHARAYAFASLGQVNYFSCVNIVDVVVGNSSSGLIEVPSLGKPTINIGDRQLGRVKSLSVIDSLPMHSDIKKALEVALSDDFAMRTRSQSNPYELPETSVKIAEILREKSLINILKKRFWDLEFTCE